MVKCIKNLVNDSFAFLKGIQYKILDEYIGTIVIQDENKKEIVFKTPDIIGGFDYTRWFVNI